MEHAIGRVREIRLGSGGHLEACISCPDGAIPAPGQYLLAYDLNDPDVVLSSLLFTVERDDQGFWANSLLPTRWEPGARLNLVGPLGRGFDLPHNIQRLGLVALGETVSRLMPLVHLITQTHAGVTLFTDLSLLMLPVALEVYPLASLKDSLDWPDFMALDVPLEMLPEMRATFGLSDSAVLPCPAQVLVTAPMPCAGMAKCGACAVPARRGWKLVCEDGPVFDLKMLKW
jgi:Iron-sulfur cluster binding domain of dihydroorotate dehydrogenase B